LVHVAAEAANLKIAVASVQSIVPSAGDGCAGPLYPSIQLVPGDAGKAVGFLPSGLAPGRSAECRIELP
jgi:hypothetical protein